MKNENFMTKSDFFTEEPEGYCRKRNASLGAAPHTDRAPEHPKNQQMPPIKYRRHRLQNKIEKFRQMKAGTKMCMDNLANYLSLKKEITQPKNKLQTTTETKARPKLAVKNINIDSVSRTPTLTSRGSRMRSLTEGSPARYWQPLLSPLKNSEMIDKLVLPSTCLLPMLGADSKPYHQLSLRQIVEEQAVPSGRYSMFMKLTSVVGRKSGIDAVVRRPSDDYSVSGW